MPASSTIIYQAVGILETEQDTILATRNAEVVQKEVTETKSFTEIIHLLKLYKMLLIVMY